MFITSYSKVEGRTKIQISRIANVVWFSSFRTFRTKYGGAGGRGKPGKANECRHLALVGPTDCRIGQIPKKRNRFTIPLRLQKKRNRFQNESIPSTIPFQRNQFLCKNSFFRFIFPPNVSLSLGFFFKQKTAYEI